MQYAGVERVDPEKRAAQHTLTQALWTTLVAQGLRKRSTGRIEAFFFADDESAAASLGAWASNGSVDWQHEIEPVEATGPGRLRVKVVTSEVSLTPEAFHELLDVMMVAALAHGCEFDGFQINLSAVNRRPWWRIW